MKLPVIYIRHMRFEEARQTFLQGVEKYFTDGITEIEVIHGVGTYTLRKMVLAEIEKLDYVKLSPAPLRQNAGSLRLELLTPEKHLLDKYIARD